MLRGVLAAECVGARFVATEYGKIIASSGRAANTCDVLRNNQLKGCVCVGMTLVCVCVLRNHAVPEP